MEGLKVGAASKVINCEVGDAVAGMLKPRISDRVRDNLEANVFFIKGGTEQAVIINCDLLGLQRSFVEEVAKKIESATGVPRQNVLISCTHTHSGPYTKSSEWGSAKDRYMRNLERWLVSAAQEAVKGAIPAKVGYALGKARIGYNRRVCWADATHSMYGDTTKDSFAGMEGPDDPSHAVLFAVDAEGRIICVIHNNTCHATTGCAFNYISADFPGAARSVIRDALDCDLPVLYLQGTCGDVCRFNQLRQEGLPDYESSRNSERRLKEISSLLAGETLRLIREAPVHANLAVKHLFRDIKVGIRMPSEEMLRHAKEVVEKKAGEDSTTSDVDGGYLFQKGVLRIHEEYGDNPYEQVPLHALRIGDFALATVPCELYCQFGLDTKLRSPAGITAVAELTHGAMGYCPTIYGILGRGYSGATYYGSRLEPFAGYMMVDELTRMLYELFK